MTTIEVLSDGAIEVAITPPPPVEIEIVPPPPVEIEVVAGGVVQQVVGIDPEYTIAAGVIQSDPLTHKELIYTAGNLTGINIWSDEAKTTLLMQKTLNYTGGDLTSMVTTYSGVTVTKSFAYSGGNLVSFSEILT